MSQQESPCASKWKLFTAMLIILIIAFIALISNISGNLHIIHLSSRYIQSITQNSTLNIFPTDSPSLNPTANPSINPTVYPTVYPTVHPTVDQIEQLRLDFQRKRKQRNVNKRIYKSKSYLYDSQHPYLYIDTSLPGPNIPKHNVIPMDDIHKTESGIQPKCKFKGKVFCLGNPKTGTTTMKEILLKLRYQCGKTPLHTCGYNALHHYIYDIHLPLYVATDDISWVIHSKSFYRNFLYSIKSSAIFADGPWFFLYPYYDQLIPQNYSKFILTIRNSTRDVVNSMMKMKVRRGGNRTLQLDYRNVTQYLGKTPAGCSLSWKAWAMMTARNHQRHNQNVIDYFTKRGRLKDLLIIDLSKESKKNKNEQWYKITKFLGCSNISGPLPISNNAKSKGYQIDYYPKDYIINWKNYTLWKQETMWKIIEFVRNSNGVYDDKKWKQLKDLYGLINNTLI